MPTPLDKLKASEDKRVKLTDEDRKEIVRLRDEGWSWGRLAERFGVSKRLIDFTLHPEKVEENKRLRRERLLNDPQRYYDREKHSRAVKNLRTRKKAEHEDQWWHICRTCGKKFYGQPNRIYCNDKCMWTYWNHKKRTENECKREENRKD